jgi:putative toxin-antitoxin system antitoxin component (TIGR02293 family)
LDNNDMNAPSKKTPVTKEIRQSPKGAALPMVPTTGAPKEGRAGIGARARRKSAKASPDVQNRYGIGFAGNTSEVIARMRSGTPAREVPGIAADLGVSQDRLFELLRLPKSTVKGRISTDAILSTTEQDRVYRATRALTRAVEVFEDKATARLWLSEANRALGGEIPLALLDTEVGYELVLDTLERIEYGVVS